ncbi:hypothetical protein JD844_009178 [Phrynosoma platyrhinos]|uniref:Uncharacterized protein n=1 Tax=Phrynosoma platyrhinos TaxID=52577 RepID=A0ABQ7TF33_PHRPL|nr:hypothetical protein JD844_009178 [Phrynosoma platyrhinos]
MKINAKVHEGLCQRCKEVLEWRVKFNKYKPLTQPKKWFFSLTWIYTWLLFITPDLAKSAITTDAQTEASTTDPITSREIFTSTISALMSYVYNFYSSHPFFNSVKCLQKTVKDSYHIICKPCACELDLCTKCGKREEIVIPIQTENEPSRLSMRAENHPSKNHPRRNNRRGELEGGCEINLSDTEDEDEDLLVKQMINLN